MAKIIDVLRAVQSIIENSATPPQAVYVRPDDIDIIDVSDLPVVLVAEQVAVQNNVAFKTLSGAVRVWNVEITVLVKQGEITDDYAAKDAEDMHRTWVDNILQILTAKTNATLNDTVIGISDDGFYYQVGHVAFGTQIYWGVQIIVPVHQQL